MDYNWIPDSAAEAILKSYGITPDAQRIPVNQIDFDGTLARNHARFQELDTKRAADIGHYIAQKKPIPYCVLMRKRDEDEPDNPKRYIIFDGRHRTGGVISIRGTSITAYIVEDVDAKLSHILPLTFNCIGGVRMSRHEAATNAIVLQNVHRLTLQELGQIFNLRPTVLREEMDLVKEKEFLQEQGIKCAEERNGSEKKKKSCGLTPTAIRKLKTIQNRRVYLEACKFAAESNLKTEEITTVTEALKDARESESAQLGVLRAMRQQLQPVPEAKRSKRSSFSIALTSLVNTLKDRNSWEQLGITNHAERAKVKDKAKFVYGKLELLLQ